MYSEMVNYFTVEVPHALGLKYPEISGAIVKHVIFREKCDKNFIPADKMTPRERAQFAICENGGYYENPEYSVEANKEHYEFIKAKFLLIAEAAILNHEAIEHPGRVNEESRRRIAEINYLLGEHALTEFEKRLILPTTNAWSFEPQYNAKTEAFSTLI